jgi:hypothetical protein
MGVCQGISVYAPEIVLTSDCGGSNGYRNHLWKRELPNLAKDIKKPLSGMHYPRGTGTGNNIEHRLFSFISKNRQGIPLISEVIRGEFISATKTNKGLTVTCI